MSLEVVVVLNGLTWGVVVGGWCCMRDKGAEIIAGG